MVIEHCRKKVVCCADCVEVAGEMEVDIFHRNNLCIAAACCAAFNTENRSEGRFAESNGNVFADAFKTVSKTNGGGGFAFACGGGGNCGYEDKFSVFAVGFSKELGIDLCFIFAVLFEIFFVNMCEFCNLGDRLHFASLGDLNIGFEFHWCHPPMK